MMGGLAYLGASGGDIFGKMMPLGLALVMAGPAVSEVISCEMADGDALNFSIDRNQFVDAVDANEPPRRKVTHVRYGAKAFPAEPILIGDMLGFQADGLSGSTMMFVIQPGGAAVLSNRGQGLRVEGTCEVVN